ncbi:metallophosphoesterase [Suttonella ornithocola]|uniref:Putative phosphoesterase n=1 Tax=Suttonella ornithocola TaxID=279832 RepID=A0A380MWV3_9GAMM|nr:metallophosphoesterase [Suttonella ornithocola]SUO97080.1 putative phosphoesterase [Suttonella ornithocola]
MKIAIHSDLHTEYSFCLLEALEQADLLLLAGDIGDNYSLPIFFKHLRSKAPSLPIIYILGNHDRWGYTLLEGINFHREIANRYQIRLLDNEAVIFQDLLICGTTLWTNFMLAGTPEASMEWAKRLPDFKDIFIEENKRLTPEIMVDLFNDSVAFLKRTLNYQSNHIRKKLVVSHFLPARELISPKHSKTTSELVKSAYWTSDIPEIYQLADIWVYGHSHTNIITNVGNTQFISNQRGYSNQYNQSTPDSHYKIDYLIEI